MGSLSDYAENKMIDHLLGTAYTSVATVYLALSTADPLDTGAGMAEPADTYVRKAITFGAAASRVITQSGDVTWDAATGSWGTITHWAIFDASTVGNMLAHGALGASKAIVSGNTPSIASASINITVSAGEISDYAATGFLDRMFRNQALTISTTYVGLTTATVSDSNTGSTITEVSGGSYARVQVAANGGASPTWDLAASGTTDNTHDITFPTATASWGTATSVVICDAATLGNLLFYDNDMADQLIGIGDTYKFVAGALDITVS